MMIDQQANQYDAEGNSTDFKRCPRAWELFGQAYKAMAVSYQLYVIAWNEYRQHVITCPECVAMKGRFAEEASQE